MLDLHGVLGLRRERAEGQGGADRQHCAAALEDVLDGHVNIPVSFNKWGI